MNRLVGLLFAIGLLFSVAPGQGEPQRLFPIASLPYLKGEILIQLRSELLFNSNGRVFAPGAGNAEDDARRLNRLLASVGVRGTVPLDVEPATYRLALPPQDDAATLARRLAADPAVVFAEPHYVRQAFRIPDDPGVSRQWALSTINAFDAWEQTTGHDDLLIAVVDTGVLPTHPDLVGKVQPGYNALLDNNQSNDDNGHGTAVAGLIAARTNNHEGIAGVCWNCSIMPVKVLNQYGFGKDADLARGIRWATDHGAHIINLSLGGAENSQILRKAVEYAFEQGVLLVASSGNDHQAGNQVNYPAAFPQVVAVGATGNTDALTPFSTTGSYLDLTAPGVGLWTTTLDGAYGSPDGTSYSSPFVSGVAGLVLSLRDDLSNQDVACILYLSADDRGPPGRDPEYGWGRINALHAVQVAQDYRTCPLSPLPLDPTVVEWKQHQSPLKDATTAFSPVLAIPTHYNQTYFPETRHTLSGSFYHYWKQQGGLSTFGFPISEEFFATDDEGQVIVVQYFERFRFERQFNQADTPTVQLSRLGDEALQLRGKNWFTFAAGTPQDDCRYFAETGHTLCGAFLDYWSRRGLTLDGAPEVSFAESLALFGQPISEPQIEEIVPGERVRVQWFERARFEDHGTGGVLLGLLGSEVARARGWY
jgi:thermitase